MFGYDAFAAEFARVREDGRAVALKVLAILNPGGRLAEELFEPSLASQLPAGALPRPR
jgi:hypothetical protein